MFLSIWYLLALTIIANLLLITILSELVIKETLISIKNLGVQLEFKRKSGRKSKLFIDHP